MNGSQKPITAREEAYARALPSTRAMQFQHSRGCVRKALAELLKVPALTIPLNAPPGKPPKLAKGWGYISFSHCCDALFIGWSKKKIGVDIERTDRSFNANELAKRYYSNKEIDSLKDLKDDELRFNVLKKWVIKEAAIKWQRGRLLENISHWNYCDKSRLATHNQHGFQVKVHQIINNIWCLGIAYDRNVHPETLIICQDGINLK